MMYATTGDVEVLIQGFTPKRYVPDCCTDSADVTLPLFSGYDLCVPKTRVIKATIAGSASLVLFVVLALSCASHSETGGHQARIQRGGTSCGEEVAVDKVKWPESYAASPVSADCAAKRNVTGSDVILLMGQSNMGGRGLGYDAELDGPNNPRIQQWSRANTTITASERLEHADLGTVSQTYVGMGTAFGRAYVETLPVNRNVLLVPTAYRGTQLVDGPWSVGGNLFEDAVTRMELALATNEVGENCVAAVLWHQGESDAGAHIDQETYQSTWTGMINTLRARIPAAAEAPVVLGEFTPAWIASNQALAEPILSAIRAIPDIVPFTAVATSDCLLSNSHDDNIHFDATSQRAYGQRYFDRLGEAIRNRQQ